MRPDQRIVTELPLKKLWDDDGSVAAERLHDLSGAQVRELLRAGSVRFMVANVGSLPEWINEARCFAFWGTELPGT